MSLARILHNERPSSGAWHITVWAHGLKPLCGHAATLRNFESPSLGWSHRFDFLEGPLPAEDWVCSLCLRKLENMKREVEEAYQR